MLSINNKLTVSVTITPTTRGVIMGIKLTVVLAIPISMPAWLGDKSIVFNVQPIIVPLLRPTNRVIRTITERGPSMKSSICLNLRIELNRGLTKPLSESQCAYKERPLILNYLLEMIKLTVSLTITPTTNGVIRGIKLPKALLIPINLFLSHNFAYNGCNDSVAAKVCNWLLPDTSDLETPITLPDNQN
uniref:Uncharacterized protein n=1 Tax=Glossina austeni TaxID=7395 RepID=A0A1A9VA45_GLOAU